MGWRQDQVEVCPREVVALAEQRFAEVPREGVSEAGPLVQCGRVAPASIVIVGADAADGQPA